MKVEDQMSERKKTGGRAAGTPNKVTQEFRHTIQALLEENRLNVALWLTAVAEGDSINEIKPDPAKALDLLSKLAEFAAPKLGRTEHVGEGGGPVLFAKVVREIVDPKKEQT